jgi:elongation factor Ts
MAVSAKDVKALRDRTGIGMMDCKRALEEAGGDIDAAVQVLRKKGLAAAAKRGGRAAGEGRVAAMLSEDGRVAGLVELNCESDFVARSDDFGALVKDILDQVLAVDAGDVEGLLAQPCAGDESRTVGTLITDAIAKLGENTVLRRFLRMKAGENEALWGYTHHNHRVASLVKASVGGAGLAASPELAAALKDVAMHVAFARPIALKPEDIPPEVIEREREVYLEQMKDKPEHLHDKIVQGKLKGFYKENCLVDQTFFKDTKASVANYLADAAKKLAGDIKLVDFAVFELGEEPD